jgi:alpha-tubulin suppressor-like RCC1 family protein
MNTGALQCWGYNFFGQLGNGTTNNSSIPVQVTGLTSGVVAVFAGRYHNCALTNAGAVQCWGSNVVGELGNGTTTDSSTPVFIMELNLSDVAKDTLATGYLHGCVLNSNSSAVECWGNNNYGQLGNGSTASSTTPVGVTGLFNGVYSITAGSSHNCALISIGAVQCWGSNSNGQLGTGNNSNSNTAVTVSGVNSAVAITAGFNHTCALTNGGTVLCWGSNNDGQLGNGGVTDSNTPVAVSGLPAGVIAIAAGGYHTCARTNAGAVWCWGSNSGGQLGSGTINTSNPVPAQVQNLPAPVDSLSAGLSHTCAVTNGQVMCWGDNGFNQLGVDGSRNSITPVVVSGLPAGRIGAVTAGASHSCVTVDGAALCWGDNSFGELGNASAIGLSIPVAVNGLSSGVNAIAAGHGFTCAQSTGGITGGTVQCWGWNNNGQLGNGTIVNSSIPKQVLGVLGSGSNYLIVPSAPQTIIFGALSNQTLGTAPFAINATAAISAGSSLPVTFSSTTTGVCTVSGNTVTLLTAGTCTIAADQVGNNTYLAAPEVTQSFTVGAAAVSPQVNLVTGWNLVGNSVNASLTVANAFPIAPSTTNVSTVWKWLAASSQWAFYSPTLPDGGAPYAASKGFVPLIVINGGEGFWVNAKSALTLQLPTGTAIASTTFADQASGTNNLPQGWSLISTGDNPTPRSFVNSIALTQPVTPDVAATSLTTLWAWDSALTNWYFYASSLDNAGTLTNYITNKNYEDFTVKGKTLDQTTGFWVNHP